MWEGKMLNCASMKTWVHPLGPMCKAKWGSACLLPQPWASGDSGSPGLADQPVWQVKGPRLTKRGGEIAEDIQYPPIVINTSSPVHMFTHMLARTHVHTYIHTHTYTTHTHSYVHRCNKSFKHKEDIRALTWVGTKEGLSIIKSPKGPRKMAQQLRKLALSEDLGTLPSTQMAVLSYV